MNSIAEYGSALNSSKTGTGKTVMGTHVAMQLNCPVAVIAPKAVLPHWRKELVDHGIIPLFVTNYEKVRRGMRPYLTKTGNRHMKWDLPEGTLLIFDEVQRCVKEGSLVTLADGSLKRIENVRAGDYVLTPLGPRAVTNSECTGDSNIVLVSHEHGGLYCTHDHKIYTNRGWVEAGKATDKDSLLLSRLRETSPRSPEQAVSEVLLRDKAGSHPAILRCMWERVFPVARRNEGGELLFPLLREHGATQEPNPGSGIRNAGEDEGAISVPSGIPRAPGTDEGLNKPHASSGNPEESIGGSCGNTTPAPVWWKRSWTYRAAAAFAGAAIGGLGRGVLRVGEGVQSFVADNAGGFGAPGAEDCGGSRRGIAQFVACQGKGFSERLLALGERVESYAYFKFRDPIRPERRRFQSSRVLRVVPCGSARCYDLSIEEADCFFADGVLVHNCKSPFTLNSLLLITARMQRINTLLLSATAAEDCTEMRAIGYALGLHSLNNSTATHLSWQKWMLKHGCWQDEWKSWRSGPKSKLEEVHSVLYRDRAVRLTEEDMPEAFRENLIIEEPLEFDANNAIKRFYRENRITPAIIDAFVEKAALPDDAKTDEDPVLVKMLRARQMAEAVKVPDIVDMARDLVEEGRSVVVFLNFRESALAAQQAIAEAIGHPVSLVIGGQTPEERSANVQAFSDDRVHAIVCTTAAGGTGLDGLQDLRGDRPRVSLISPSFSAQEFRQVLGRLPRAYAKSGVQQRILIASDTIEEYVLRAIHRKLANLEALHGK